MPKPYINDAGTWRQPKEIHINDSGVWRNGKELWVKRNGVWRQIFKRALQLQITADTQDYDLFIAAGSPTEPLDIILTIGLDVIVGASATDKYALYCSANFPAGSTVKIVNKGKVMGAGGNGGSALFFSAGNGSNGSTEGLPGGPALSLGAPTLIDNNVGHLFGGGGGGGAMDVKTPTTSIYHQWVYSGGGGAGSVCGLGGTSRWGGYIHTAADGSQEGHGNGLYLRGYNTYATGATSRTSGGGFGAPGQLNESLTTPHFSSKADPGAAGRAVDRNGFDLAFTGGENSVQLKGAYD